MPKLKRTPRQVENDRLEANIRYFMWRESMDIECLALRLDVSERTVQRWLQDVGKLTWADIISLSMVFGCTVVELAGGELTYEAKRRVIA